MVNDTLRPLAHRVDSHFLYTYNMLLVLMLRNLPRIAKWSMPISQAVVHQRVLLNEFQYQFRQTLIISRTHTLKLAQQ